jgi:cell fate (sporulation/competence/biofilm development) regulator YmcA (YheA/YmcA/DUF963 family)
MPNLEPVNRKLLFSDLMFAVRQMRKCQKKYFSTRNRDVMNQSKMWEKKVDDILEQIDNMPIQKLPI